jgi:hypothetical protein
MTVASKVTAMAEAAGLSLEPPPALQTAPMLPGPGRSSSEEIIFLWRALFSAAGAVAATGKVTQTPDEIAPMRKASNHVGPIIVGFHVDHSDDHAL